MARGGCGGHTNEYHNHERLICLYDEDAPGHSTKVGTAGRLNGNGGYDENGTPIYGKYSATGVTPSLDACGGRFGVRALRTPGYSQAEPTIKLNHENSNYRPRQSTPFLIFRILSVLSVTFHE